MTNNTSFFHEAVTIIVWCIAFIQVATWLGLK